MVLLALSTCDGDLAVCYCWRCPRVMGSLLSGTLALSTCDGDLAVCYCWRCLHVMETLLSVTVGAVYM